VKALRRTRMHLELPATEIVGNAEVYKEFPSEVCKMQSLTDTDTEPH
jgi:hypothetical protein